MNILIIKTGALGDVLRTSFIAQFLKDKYRFQKNKLYWLTGERVKPLFINNIYVDEVITVSEKEKIENLKKESFDIVINLEEGFEECKLASSLNPKKLIGAFLNKEGKIDYTKDSEYWFDMSLISKKGKKEADILKKKNKKTHRQIIAEMMGVKDYKKYEPFLRLTPHQRVIANNFLRRHNLSRKDLIVGINVGSAERWLKALPIKKTIELINSFYKQFNAKILLFGGPDEIERNHEICKHLKSPIIDTGCGNNLLEFPALVSVCSLLITSDTFGLHVALALKRKTIVLIGPTSASEIDLYNMGKKITAKSNCLCCYRKDCKSMEKIDVSEILTLSKKLLRKKITLLISAFREPKVSRAIEAALNQKTKYDYEVLVSVPDKETQDIVRSYMKKYKNLKLFQDPGKGKSFALNLVFSTLDTDILILTDGDVYINENAVEDIVDTFNDPEIGCLSGRPVPQESKNTKYGYWANFLFDSAHRIRKKAFKTNSFLECSGYLFAFRKEFIKKIPIDVAEDTVIAYIFWEKGYKISYVETAEVYVKNATNIRDWINQKLRTHKSHGKLNEYVDIITTPKVKSFKTESKGIIWLLSYPMNAKEAIWSLELALARFYTWMKFFLDTHIFDRHYTDAWKRIESTK
jgi:heptosyltransferase-2